MLLADVRDRITDDDILINCYSRDKGRSPENILIEKERRIILIQLIKDVMGILNKRDRKILWLYIKGCTQGQIAAQLGVTQPAVFQRLNKIPQIVRKCLLYHHIILVNEYLTDNPSTAVANTPRELLGWPVTFMEKAGATGQWGISRGKKVYRSKTECKMIEYLKYGFHMDELPKCCLCGNKCTRKENLIKL